MAQNTLPDFSGLASQMEPLNREGLGTRLSFNGGGALERVPTLSVQTPPVRQVDTSQFPTVVPTFDNSLLPQNPESLKGFGKAINSVAGILENPDVQKFLIALGSDVDPKGQGFLGQFGNALIEEQSRQRYRAALEQGATPAQAAKATRGLSTEGRLQEEQQFQANQQTEFERGQTERRTQVAERGAAVDEAGIGLKTIDLELQGDALEIRRTEEENRNTLANLKLEVDKQLADAQVTRSRYENLLDAARADEINFGISTGSSSKFREANRVRDALLDQLKEQQPDISSKLRRIGQDIEDFDSNNSGFWKSLRGRSINQLLEKDPEKLTPEEALVLENRKALVTTRDSLQQALQQNELLQQELIQDIETDVEGRSDFRPAAVDSRGGRGGGARNQGIPRVNSIEAARSLPSGSVWQGPDGGYYAIGEDGKPHRVINLGGK